MVVCAGLAGATEWRVPVRLYPTSLDTVYPVTLYFGMRSDATEGFDPFVDVAEPVFPPEGFVAYFVGDSIMPYLREDYRPSDVPGDSAADQLWQLAFRAGEGESTWVAWDADSFPFDIEYPIFMQYLVADSIPPQELWDTAPAITEGESIFVDCASFVFFRYRDITFVRDASLPKVAALLAAHPNPFNACCTFLLDAPEAGVLIVFDLAGREVASFAVAGGRSEVVWDASALPGGVYVAEFASGRAAARATIVLVR